MSKYILTLLILLGGLLPSVSLAFFDATYEEGILCYPFGIFVQSIGLCEPQAEDVPEKTAQAVATTELNPPSAADSTREVSKPPAAEPTPEEIQKPKPGPRTEVEIPVAATPPKPTINNEYITNEYITVQGAGGVTEADLAAVYAYIDTLSFNSIVGSYTAAPVHDHDHTHSVSSSIFNNNAYVTRDHLLATVDNITDDISELRSELSTGAGSGSIWSTSGSDVYRLGGSVGIGTTAPSGNLDIQDANGRLHYNAPQLALYGNGTGNTVFSSNISGESTNRFLIKADGNLRWGDGLISNHDVNLRRVATGTLRTSGTLLLDGSLGVGTTTPNSLLTVDGTLGATTLCDQNGNNCAAVTALTSGASPWSTAGGDIFYNSGNVGIGTTTPAYDLAVAGNIGFTGALYDSAYSAGTNGQVLLTTGAGTRWTSTSSLGFAGSVDLSAYMRNDGDTATGDYNFDSNTFVIDSVNNRAGIGTSTPSARLQVQSSDATIARFIRESGANGAIEIGNTGDGSVWLGVNSGGNFAVGNAQTLLTSSFFEVDMGGPNIGAVTVGNNGLVPQYHLEVFEVISDGYFAISSTTNGDILVVDDNGNLGIGTTTPASTLDVWGDLRVGMSAVPLFWADAAANQAMINTVTARADNLTVGNIAPELYESGGDIDHTGSYFSTQFTQNAGDNDGVNLHIFTDVEATSNSNDANFGSANHVYSDTTFNLGTMSASNNQVEYEGSADVLDMRAVSNVINFDPVANSDVLNFGSVTSNSANLLNGSTSAVYGSNNFIYNSGTNANFLLGVGSQIYNDGGSTNAAYGLFSSVFNNSGTLNTGYGLYISDVVTDVNEYGIYQLGSDDINYLGGLTGIGTTSTAASARLAVQSTSTNDILNLFETDGAEVLTVLENGNVGIGVADPEAALELENQTSGNGHTLQLTGKPNNGGEYYGRLHFDNGNTSADVASIIAQRSGSGESGADLQFWTRDDGGVNQERMVILDTGDVGIGTTSPNAKLDVWGDFRVGTSSTPLLLADTAAGRIIIGDESVATEGILAISRDGYDYSGVPSLVIDRNNFAGDDKWFVGKYNGNELLSMKPSGGGVVDITAGQDLNYDLRISTDNADNPQLYLENTASGYVGIGTSTPSHTLTVDGDAMLTGALFDNSYSAGTNGQILQTTGTGVNWVATSSLGLGGSSLFTDAGDTTYLTSLTDALVVGTTSSSSALLNIAGLVRAETVSLTTDNVLEHNDTSFLMTSTTLDAIALGPFAGGSVSTSLEDNMTAIGSSAGRNNSGSSNFTGIGYFAGRDNSGSNFTAVGANAGDDNTANGFSGLGVLAGGVNQGSNFSGIGYSIARFNTGIGFSGVGAFTGLNNTGDYVSAVGYAAAAQNYGDRIAAVGYEAGAYNAGNNNVFLGNEAGYDANYYLTGGDNTFLGANATYDTSALVGGLGNASSTITNSTAVGANITLTDSNTVILGNNANVGIGTSSPATKLTVDGVITPNTDNTYTLGNSSYRWSEVFAANGVINTSDERLKSNVQAATYGLEEILALKPVSFTWTDNPEQGTKLGLLAQDVEDIIPEIVVTGDDPDETKGVRYTELFAVVINGMQEMWDTVTGNQDKIAELEERIEALESTGAASNTPSNTNSSSDPADTDDQEDDTETQVVENITETEVHDTESDTASTSTATSTDEQADTDSSNTDTDTDEVQASEDDSIEAEEEAAVAEDDPEAEESLDTETIESENKPTPPEPDTQTASST